MKNDFKPAYERVNNSDGSVEFRFSSKRIGVQHGFGPVLLALVVLWPASCAVTIPVVHPFLDSNGPGVIVVWNVLAAALLFFGMYKYNYVRDNVKVVPSGGLGFGGKSLPREEIDSIGVSTFRSGGNSTGTAFVYAVSKGRQIQITKNVDPTLASSLKDEFIRALGGEWES